MNDASRRAPWEAVEKDLYETALEIAGKSPPKSLIERFRRLIGKKGAPSPPEPLIKRFEHLLCQRLGPVVGLGADGQVQTQSENIQKILSEVCETILDRLLAIRRGLEEWRWHTPEEFAGWFLRVQEDCDKAMPRGRGVNPRPPRGSGHQRGATGGTHHPIMEGPPSVTSVGSAPGLRWVLDCLKGLRGNQRKVLERRLKGMPDEDIAADLGISVRAVIQAAFHGRNNLNDIILCECVPRVCDLLSPLVRDGLAHYASEPADTGSVVVRAEPSGLAYLTRLARILAYGLEMEDASDGQAPGPLREDAEDNVAGKLVDSLGEPAPAGLWRRNLVKGAKPLCGYLAHQLCHLAAAAAKDLPHGLSTASGPQTVEMPAKWFVRLCLLYFALSSMLEDYIQLPMGLVVPAIRALSRAWPTPRAPYEEWYTRTAQALQGLDENLNELAQAGEGGPLAGIAADATSCVAPPSRLGGSDVGIGRCLIWAGCASDPEVLRAIGGLPTGPIADGLRPYLDIPGMHDLLRKEA